MKIYLAGSVPKGDKEKETFFDWRKEYKKRLSSINDLEFIDPIDVSKYEWDPFLVFGGDCSYIKESDLVLVYAEEKIGTGTSQEMLVAKYFRKPVITVLPKDTHHRRSNINFEGRLLKDWIHPFIFSTSDLIVENVENAVPWIEEYMKDPISKKIKDMTTIDSAIEGFKKIRKG